MGGAVFPCCSLAWGHNVIMVIRMTSFKRTNATMLGSRDWAHMWLYPHLLKQSWESPCVPTPRAGVYQGSQPWGLNYTVEYWVTRQNSWCWEDAVGCKPQIQPVWSGNAPCEWWGLRVAEGGASLAVDAQGPVYGEHCDFAGSQYQVLRAPAGCLEASSLCWQAGTSSRPWLPQTRPAPGAWGTGTTGEDVREQIQSPHVTNTILPKFRKFS